ncbi:MAG: alpha/beta fold hydrolase [Actinomycetes bacterium]
MVHRLADGPGRPLLLLHGLGERTPTEVPTRLLGGVRRPGPVLGLDFTGHGQSTVPVGGGYTSEILVADVDAVLVETGPVTLLGRGLGAYVGLLTAAARPDLVRGVVLTDGPGLVGGGTHPGSPLLPVPAPGGVVPPDPFALLELARDVRPPDYAQSYARYAVDGSDLDDPIWVSTVVRPEWVVAICGEPGVVRGTVADGLSRYASTA